MLNGPANGASGRSPTLSLNGVRGLRSESEVKIVNIFT